MTQGIIISRFLKATGIKFTKLALNNLLKEHPLPDSFSAINDILNYYQISNESFVVPKEQLDSLSLPFIAKILRPVGFVVVKSIDQETVGYISEKGQSLSVPRDAFLSNWTGITMLATVSDKSGEPDYALNHRQEVVNKLRSLTIGFTFLFLPLLLVALRFRSNLSYLYLGQAVLSFFGSVVSGLLIYQGIDKSNPFIQKICAGGGRIDCNSIIESRGAKLLNLIGWSEIGFVYFFSNFLLLTFSENLSGALALSALISLLSLPYVVYSITYQWLIFKKWCLLCLVVQLILAIQFAIQYRGLSFLKGIDYRIAGEYLIAILVVVALLCLIIPFAKDSIYSHSLRRRIVRFKTNKEFFNVLLELQPKLDFNNDAGGMVVFGNENASFHVTLVTNPGCKPCEAAFKKIDLLLKHFKEDLKVTFIFRGDHEEKDFESSFIRQIIGLHLQKGKNISYQAYRSWYRNEKKDFDIWRKEYPIDVDNQLVDSNFYLHSEWCYMNNVLHTPSIYVNDRLLPNAYEVDDLKWFM